MDSAVVVERLNHSGGTAEMPLGTPRRGQIRIRAPELSHFDQPAVGRERAEHGELVTRLAGIHVDWDKKHFKI